MKLTQVALRCGTTEQVVWLEHKDNVRIRRGNVVTLVGDDRRWTVRDCYQTIIARPHTDWNVGGLTGRAK